MAAAEPTPITVLSLATGAAGIELGLRLAGLRTRLVACVESDPYAAAVLLARMEDETLEPAPVWCGNLEQFDARPFAGVGLVTAGYPCPAMSTAGKRLGQRDPRWLWPEVARVVSECRPAYVFLENVGGHLQLAFDDVWADLGAMGYEREAGLFSAAEVGAPHERERLFVLAHAERSGFHTADVPSGEPRSGGFVAWSGKELAHAERVRGERRGAGGEMGGSPGEPGGERRERQRGGNAAYDSRPQLADAGSEGREGFRPSAAQQLSVPARNGAELAGGWGELGHFPPAKNDFEAWTRVLARVPEAQPAVCELAERTPARMDRLRVLGNGVVPLVAAHAFRTLAGRLGVSEDLGLTS